MGLIPPCLRRNSEAFLINTPPLGAGLLIAYSQSQKILFEIKDQEGENKKIEKSYLNHLPSFSSAILHFGTCRDLFFPLLKILVYLYNNGTIEDLFKNFNEKEFYRQLSRYDIEKYKKALVDFSETNFARENNINDIELFKKDLEEKYFREASFKKLACKYIIKNADKNSFRIELKRFKEFKNQINKDKGSFNDDLEILLKNISFFSSERKGYLENAGKFFNLNKFRNTFAHQLRLLWWKNEKCGNSFFLKKEVYEAISNNNNHEIVKTYLTKVFKDTIDYENDIFTENDCDNLVSSVKILQDTHDTIAKFLNSTFELILPDSTV